MRLELSGSLVRPEPLIIKYDETTLNIAGDIFTWLEQGYTHFDVICIGGGGGSGGGIKTNNTGTKLRSYGGAGGGGGFHRVRGLLSALDTEWVQVVVGTAGGKGNDHASNPALTTDGGDGGFSSFSEITCQASGGKGGKRVQSNSATVTTQAHGGEGGLGNRNAAGGGGAGGLAGTPSPPSSGPGIEGTKGEDGTFFSNIGQGGGGGAGGVGIYEFAGETGIPYNKATAGGRGSYNPGDTSVYGPGGTPQFDEDAGAPNIVPGGASGAKAAPLNGLPTVYGQSSEMGVVVLRLTAE